MKKVLAASLVAGGLAASAPSFAEDVLVEIYRINPGMHEEFLRHIALLDQANAEAGLPPRQLYVHQDGASWDFLLIQPAEHTDEQGAKLGEAFRKLGIPQGAKFFVNFRRFIAEHTDTFAESTTAADYLKKLD
jgi:hypothetical protein